MNPIDIACELAATTIVDIVYKYPECQCNEAYTNTINQRCKDLPSNFFIHMNAGICHYYLGLWVQAQEFTIRAIHNEEQQPVLECNTQTCLMWQGRISRKLGQFAHAKSVLSQATKFADSHITALAYSELGWIELCLGMPEEARKYFRSAIQLRQKIRHVQQHQAQEQDFYLMDDYHGLGCALMSPSDNDLFQASMAAFSKAHQLSETVNNQHKYVDVYSRVYRGQGISSMLHAERMEYGEERNDIFLGAQTWMEMARNLCVSSLTPHVLVKLECEHLFAYVIQHRNETNQKAFTSFEGIGELNQYEYTFPVGLSLRRNVANVDNGRLFGTPCSLKEKLYYYD